MQRWLIKISMLSFVLVMFTGCPDYSHLREAPDYKNMTDSGNEVEGTDKDEKVDVK